MHYQSGNSLALLAPPFADMKDFNQFQTVFKNQVDTFFNAMIPLCDAVDQIHAEVLPSPFLSGVIDDCVANAKDVTAGRGTLQHVRDTVNPGC